MYTHIKCNTCECKVQHTSVKCNTRECKVQHTSVKCNKHMQLNINVMYLCVHSFHHQTILFMTSVILNFIIQLCSYVETFFMMEQLLVLGHLWHTLVQSLVDTMQLTYSHVAICITIFHFRLVQEAEQKALMCYAIWHSIHKAV